MPLVPGRATTPGFTLRAGSGERAASEPPADTAPESEGAESGRVCQQCLLAGTTPLRRRQTPANRGR